MGDPTQRIGRLESANRLPMSVKADAPLVEAVTMLLSNDYSQLPVMQNERDVRGIVTWTSIGSLSADEHRESDGECFYRTAR
jgi:predicted transcriptional regulator